MPSGVEALIQALAGQKKTANTPRGPIQYRQGGLPGALADVVGGTAYMPGLGSISSSEMTPVSAIHEQQGHGEGEGAISDLVAALSWKGGPSKLPKGWEAFWRPSDVHAYTTQPASLSHVDMINYRDMIRQNPELRAYFDRDKNPSTDWDLENIPADSQSEELMRKVQEMNAQAKKLREGP
jgi:hypothetical protein